MVNSYVSLRKVIIRLVRTVINVSWVSRPPSYKYCSRLPADSSRYRCVVYAYGTAVICQLSAENFPAELGDMHLFFMQGFLLFGMRSIGKNVPRRWHLLTSSIDYSCFQCFCNLASGGYSRCLQGRV